MLAASPEGLTVAEVCATTEHHPNTVREHLDGLVDQGRARRDKAHRGGPGRPAWRYSLTARSSSHRTKDHVGLALALCDALSRTSEDPTSEAIRAGRDWGRRRAAGRPHVSERGEILATVRAELHEMGYAAEPVTLLPGASHRWHGVRRETVQCDELLLRTCPLLEAASKRPDVVCAIHAGIVLGILDETHAPPTDVDLFPFSDVGGCRLALWPRGADPRGTSEGRLVL